ncbi:MAG: type I restriction endonuclease subunit R [Bacteroidales bacterium]|nr:type I restriction endonuclease subunit R [Bacteroidales bacterium]
MSKFNEATRVQMPAMVHLTRLGYKYFGKISEENAGKIYDPSTNILIEEFEKQFTLLNPNSSITAKQMLQDIRKDLKNDDLGYAFYQRLKSVSPIKLIDYDNPSNNSFYFTAEFSCKNGMDEFRPDITLFVNGLPLVFIEVKKPNNIGGMVAESKRMNQQRFPNKRLRSFINITQLMIFSNNMEYDTMGGIVPLQGAFYCTAARESAPFNCFREENRSNADIAPYNRNYPYRPVDKNIEKKILKDFNSEVIHTTPEYKTNLDSNTPTNRILTSMCSPERLLFILKYGIAYVKSEREVDGKIEVTDQKHIMRYQQMFAALAIREHLDKGATAGVVWHTQGSGKTALSYHLSHFLNDYFAKKNKVAKFYFIVDRLDLLEQATQEFEARGLVVATANSRKELMDQFRDNKSQQGASGKQEITVVNIQRFAEDKEKVKLPDYATNLQRVFILDEAHRGYRPGGCFLANLFDADPNSIKIALTGTPLLKEEKATATVFNDYFHTYYYDRSIADGYTLKIIREEIETSYKEKLTQIMDKLEQLVQKKDVRKSAIIEHENYVKELIRYVITDLTRFRWQHGDQTLGGMIICETSEQARNLAMYWDEVQREMNKNASFPTDIKAGLILDKVDKESRKATIKDFKKNMTVDVLIVFNMLLTGFDAPRLKRLYFGRKLKDHNLLQALTRVNRPYKNNRYGYVIDFADIKSNFEETNEAYLKELNRFNDPNEDGSGVTDTFTQVLENPQEILDTMRDIHDTLFDYTLNNVEEFSSEVSTIQDKEELLKLKKVLEAARDCGNLVRTFGDDDLKEKFSKVELTKLSDMLKEVQHHISIINQKEAFSTNEETTVLVNEAMQDIEFTFSKIGEEELKLISGGRELQEKWRDTIRAFMDNIDQDDPEFITLREAFMQRFKEHGFVIDSIAKFNEETAALDAIIARLKAIQQSNKALLNKYNGDAKFARVHKRIREINADRKEKSAKPIFTFSDHEISIILNMIKEDVDQRVYDKNDILKKDAYFEQTVLKIVADMLSNFPQISEQASPEDYIFVKNGIARQYLNQYNATYATA